MGLLISVVIMGFGLYLISYEAPVMWGAIWQWPSAIIALLVFITWMILSGRWINSSAARVAHAQQQAPVPAPAYLDSQRTSNS
jgi:hypothetical protein